MIDVESRIDWDSGWSFLRVRSSNLQLGLLVDYRRHSLKIRAMFCQHSMEVARKSATRQCTRWNIKIGQRVRGVVKAVSWRYSRGGLIATCQSDIGHVYASREKSLMPRLSHARLSYVHFLTRPLNRRLSHHSAWERFKNPRLTSRHRLRLASRWQLRINYDAKSNISPPLPTITLFLSFSFDNESFFSQRRWARRTTRKLVAWILLGKIQVSCRYVPGEILRQRTKINASFFAYSTLLAQWVLLIILFKWRRKQQKQRFSVASRTRAKFATLRSPLYIHTDLSFARLSGRRGARAFVMGDGVGAGTRWRVCMHLRATLPMIYVYR